MRGSALIFVTVGNATQAFRRLLDATDRAAGAGLFGEESVFMQTGSDESFHASHCQQERFIDMERFERMLATASLVVSHGGAGTLLQVLRAGKTPIVMPRLQRYREHVDDHQVELVTALANEGRVIPVFEADELAAAVNQARQRNPQARANSSPPILRLVAEAIEELAAKRKGTLSS
jgi:beta-1,4-N-acetylglucosaminyltransferase